MTSDDERPEIVQEAERRHAESQRKQQELVDALREDTDDDTISGEIEMAGLTLPYEWDIRGGDLERIETLQTDAQDPSSNITPMDAVREMCELLADIVTDPDLDGEAFLNVFRQTSPAALSGLFQQIQEDAQQRSGEAGKRFRGEQTGQDVRGRGPVSRREQRGGPPQSPPGRD